MAPGSGLPRTSSGGFAVSVRAASRDASGAGKGDRRRPRAVSEAELVRRWKLAFHRRRRTRRGETHNERG
jgi:hypothetical protein